jgi:transposase
LQAAMIAEHERAARIEIKLAVAKTRASDDQALIAHQILQIAKLTRVLYGRRSEHTLDLLDQMALAFEELESFVYEGRDRGRAGRRQDPQRKACCIRHRRRPGRSRYSRLDAPAGAMADVTADARRKAKGSTTSVISPLALEAVRPSTPCSTSSAQSTARAPSSAVPFGRSYAGDRRGHEIGAIVAA